MVSRFIPTLNLAGAWPAISDPGNTAYDRMQHALSAVDLGLSIVAIIFVGAAGLWQYRRSWSWSLEQAPLRRNEVREDVVALAILVYFTAAAVLSGILHLLPGGSDNLFSTMLVGNGAHVCGIVACVVIAAKRFEGGVWFFCFGGHDGSGAVSGKVAQLSSPLSKGGLRGVLQSVKNLRQVRLADPPPLLVKEESRQGNDLIGSGSWRSSLALTGLLGLVAIGLCPIVRDVTVAVILRFAPDYQFASHSTIEALHDPAQPFGVVVTLWVGAIVVAPLAEEFFFRGLLQTFLVSVLPSRWLGIGLASLAFGLVHIPQPHAVVALVFLSALLGYAYERTGSLVAPVLIHAAFNAKTLVWVALGDSPM